jgi:uncharacterized protein (DUF2249 family)
MNKNMSNLGEPDLRRAADSEVHSLNSITKESVDGVENMNVDKREERVRNSGGGLTVSNLLSEKMAMTGPDQPAGVDAQLQNDCAPESSNASGVTALTSGSGGSDVSMSSPKGVTHRVNRKMNERLSGPDNRHEESLLVAENSSRVDKRVGTSKARRLRTKQLEEEKGVDRQLVDDHESIPLLYLLARDHPDWKKHHRKERKQDREFVKKIRKGKKQRYKRTIEMMWEKTVNAAFYHNQTVMEESEEVMERDEELYKNMKSFSETYEAIIIIII